MPVPAVGAIRHDHFPVPPKKPHRTSSIAGLHKDVYFRDAQYESL